MGIVLTVFHIVSCLILVVVVLLQQGKGADMGAVFGGSSQTIFGSSGAGNFLTRLTTGAAVVFMFTSLGLTWSASHRVTSSVFDSAPAAPPPVEAPMSDVQPGAPAGEAPAAAPEAAAPEAAAPAAAQPEAAAPEAAAPAAAPPEAAAPEAAAPAAPEPQAAADQAP